MYLGKKQSALQTLIYFWKFEDSDAEYISIFIEGFAQLSQLK